MHPCTAATVQAVASINKLQLKMQAQLSEQQAQLGKRHKLQEARVVQEMSAIEERTANKDGGTQLVEGVDMRQVEAVLHARVGRLFTMPHTLTDCVAPLCVCVCVCVCFSCFAKVEPTDREKAQARFHVQTQQELIVAQKKEERELTNEIAKDSQKEKRRFAAEMASWKATQLQQRKDELSSELRQADGDEAQNLVASHKENLQR